MAPPRSARPGRRNHPSPYSSQERAIDTTSETRRDQTQQQITSSSWKASVATISKPSTPDPSWQRPKPRVRKRPVRPTEPRPRNADRRALQRAGWCPRTPARKRANAGRRRWYRKARSDSRGRSVSCSGGLRSSTTLACTRIARLGHGGGALSPQPERGSTSENGLVDRFSGSAELPIGIDADPGRARGNPLDTRRRYPACCPGAGESHRPPSTPNRDTECRSPCRWRCANRHLRDRSSR